MSDRHRAQTFLPGFTMRIHWGFKEEILTLLAQAANAPDQSDEQNLLLNEACVLLWRFDDEVLPRRADDIRKLLEVCISYWLPKTVRLMYTGALVYQGQPTTLSATILVDLLGNSLFTRDQLISEILTEGSTEKNSPGNFRELLQTFNFPGIAHPQEIHPIGLKFRFYTEIPNTQHDKFIYSCAECQYPLDQTGTIFQCSSPFCHNFKYTRAYPHGRISQRRQKSTLPKMVYAKQLKLNHLAWRTIASPLVLETTIAKYLRKIVPDITFSTIEPNKFRPGVSIFENGRRVNFEPVATHSAPTVFNYYSEIENPEETWIVVPDGTIRLFHNLKEKLPNNYKIVSSRSYPYEYLNTFYTNKKRGGARIRYR